MKTDDQWFEPGDKVMRVAWAEDLGICVQYVGSDPPFGEVLCVSEVGVAPNSKMNWVRFLGVPLNAPGAYWLARCFRKVEEIKLCINAVRKQGEPATLQPV